MVKLVPVSRSIHANQSWLSPPGYGFARGDVAIQVGLSEMAMLSTQMPLAFINEGEGKRIVALAGLEAWQNVMIAQDGSWRATYVPGALRAYPFYLAPNAEGGFVLCVDEESGLVVNSRSGNPFFSPDGELDLKVARTMEFLLAFEREKAAALQIGDALNKAGVITGWQVSYETPGGVRKVDGLQLINEQALNELPDDQFLALRRIGGLHLAYCQMISTQQMATLAQRAGEYRPPTSSLGEGGMELDFSRFRS